MTAQIHPSAIVEDGAKIGNNVAIGAFCHIGSDVELADDVVLKSHVVIAGHTSIGAGTVIYPFASLGHPPQDLKFNGEITTLVIGKNNTIREHVTMNPGTADDAGTTIVGDNCLFMMASHVAHDCVVGDAVILANNATLAGHVKVGDRAIIGGLSAVHQFVRIGEHAMIGGMSGVEHDVIPYGLVKGDRASLAGLNLIGLERRGFEKDTIQSLMKAFKQIFKTDGLLDEVTEQVANDFSSDDIVMQMVAFIRGKEDRALCRPAKKHA